MLQSEPTDLRGPAPAGARSDPERRGGEGTGVKDSWPDRTSPAAGQNRRGFHSNGLGTATWGGIGGSIVNT